MSWMTRRGNNAKVKEPENSNQADSSSSRVQSGQIMSNDQLVAFLKKILSLLNKDQFASANGISPGVSTPDKFSLGGQTTTESNQSEVISQAMQVDMPKGQHAVGNEGDNGASGVYQPQNVRRRSSTPARSVSGASFNTSDFRSLAIMFELEFKLFRFVKMPSGSNLMVAEVLRTTSRSLGVAHEL